MDKFFRILITVIVVAFVGYLAWRFSSILTYILISAILSFIGHPLVRTLDRVKIGNFKIPHVLSSLLTLLAIFTVIAALVSIFVPLIASQVSVISQIDFTQFQEWMSGPIDSLEEFLMRNNIVPHDTTLDVLVTQQVESLLDIATFQDLFSGLIGFTGSFFIGLFSTLFITFFFLKDEHLFFNGIILFVPKKYKENTGNALISIRKLLSRYFIGLFVEVTTMMTLISLGCTILGVEHALLIGFFGGMMNIIPYLGPIIGSLIGVTIGLTTNLSLGTYPEVLPDTIKILSTFAIANLIDNFVLQPWIYSTSVKAHPLEIFLVILVAGTIAGPLGMILAIPGYTVLRIIAKQFLNKFEVVQKLTERL